MTLGRHSMGTFMPGARIGQVHGTTHPADPETGARDALVFAMYHPAAALRAPALERESIEDIGRVPGVLVRSRELRAARETAGSTQAGLAGPPATTAAPPPPVSSHPGSAAPATAGPSAAEPAADDTSQLTLF